MPVVVVQEADSTFPSSTDWNFAFPAAVTPGNVVVIAVRVTTANRTPGTPTSDGSATFASVATIGGTLANHLRMWSAVENGTGNKNYKIAIGGGVAAAGLLQAWEISGASSATPTSSGTGRQDTATTAPAMVDVGLDIPSGGIMLGVVQSQAGSWTTITGTPANFSTDYSATVTYAASSTTAATAVRGNLTVTTARAAWGLAAVWSEAATGQPYAKRWGGVPHFGGRSLRRW